MKKILLNENDIPRAWYNVLPDLPAPLPPPLNPGTGKPLTPDLLQPLFPDALIEQEMSPQRWIPIPEDVLNVYRLWRPTPLVRAERFEQALKTPARIYYKNESLSPAGSHKPNTAVPQAYYNMKEGVKRLATETGAGQWGSALAMACCFFGLKCLVYMVKCSFEQKPFRRSLMHLWGADVHPSPSATTQCGRAILAVDPHSPGSLGMAISEAVEVAAQNPDTKYSLGSVLNHVLMHQTVTGLETKKQLEMIGERPDVIVGCVGGGSNFAGLVLPFWPDKAEGRPMRFLAVEPAACPTISRGPYAYDFGDTAKLTPLLKMHTLGHGFVPPAFHSGGLRYHGMAPIVSALASHGAVEAAALRQNVCFEAAQLFARTEGIVPAPETSHALRAVVEEALAAKQSKQERVIVFLFSGHGHFDLNAYDAYLAGQLADDEYPQEKIAKALKDLPAV
ncbi:MAG: TrpB-like pyridoxal phosphate-dependent enzyme [Planctomycetes bacterium]|jgi:tryptophan synthase beta chain|nr:TrpB-like pyridoxal phosphate-dependent enzyme [Planctomycetota bacterium]OQC22373.1 MAG: Tryptophan synthase beta chain [Planctomycetes bacterium ADurb.Bin069]